MGGGGDDDGDKERDVEEERLRQEAIKKAEEERRVKHKKMEEEREHLRQNIRDKVAWIFFLIEALNQLYDSKMQLFAKNFMFSQQDFI